MQDYLRDAVRTFPLKVFVCEFYKETGDERPYKQVYFASRFEIGHCSVYKKLEAVNNMMKTSNQEQFSEATQKFEQKYLGGQAQAGTSTSEQACNVFNGDQDKGFLIDLQIKRMDALSKDYLTDAQHPPLAINMSYLHLINIPTLFDVGCPPSDPSSDSLVLNMLDSQSFKVEK